MDDTLWLLAKIIGCILFIIFMGCVAYLPVRQGEHSCKNRAESQGFKYEFADLVTGCIYVLPDGRKIPENNYRTN